MDVYLNNPERKVLVIIDHDDYETIGSHSITGAITQSFLDYEPLNFEEIILDIHFVESSREEHEKNKGPADIIMPEYVPAVLVEDLLDLAKRVMHINIKLVSRDDLRNPPEKIGGYYVW